MTEFRKRHVASVGHTLTMKITVVGSGRLGSALCRAWRGSGHEITIASRSPERADVRALAQEVGGRATAISEIRNGSSTLVVLAVPYAAVDATVFEIGPLRGSLVIDCTNAIAAGMRPLYTHDTSAAEILQKQIPEARVFKAFNTLGSETLARPVLNGRRASGFYCGRDTEGQMIVETLIRDVGLNPVLVGNLDAAWLLEVHTLFWLSIVRERGHRAIGFEVLEECEGR
ncbi:MAG: NAD(P)-binding domain-containing protein [Myxococcota bacterium]